MRSHYGRDSEDMNTHSNPPKVPSHSPSIQDYSDDELRVELARREKYRNKVKVLMAGVSDEDLELELKRRGR
jgi:hypothetical protein